MANKKIDWSVEIKKMAIDKLFFLISTNLPPA